MCAPFGFSLHNRIGYVSFAHKHFKLYPAKCLLGAPLVTLKLAGQSDGIERHSLRLQQSQLALNAEQRALKPSAGAGGQ